MSNPIKGETSFTVEGKTYTLKYSADAFVELEEKLDRGIVDVLAEMASWKDDPRRIRFGLARSVLWAGLQESQPERLPDGSANPVGVDLKLAGDLILMIGGIENAFGLITSAIAVAFPQAETKGARPPNRAARRKAAAGTGKNS